MGYQSKRDPRTIVHTGLRKELAGRENRVAQDGTIFSREKSTRSSGRKKDK